MKLSVENKTFIIAVIISAAVHLIFIMPFFQNKTISIKENRENNVKVRIVNYRELPSQAVLSDRKKIEKNSGKKNFNVNNKNGLLNSSANDKHSSKKSLLRYEDIVKQKIEDTRKYPYFSKKQKEEGNIKIQFTLLKNGTYKNLKIVRASKYPRLNNAALTTIKNAGTFPPIPSDLNIDQLNLELYIEFKLN